MFNIGIIEFLVIFFFLILFIKPNEFPNIFKNLGLMYRKINQFLSNLKFDLSEIELNKDLKINKIKQNKNNGLSRSSKRNKK